MSPDDSGSGWESTHHPFTAPCKEDESRVWAGELQGVGGQHYDLVLNGMEIGGGATFTHPLTLSFVH